MEKEKKPVSKTTIRLLLVMGGLLVLLVVFAAVRPGLAEETEELEAEKQALTSQLQQIRDLEANETGYLQQSEEYEKKIQEIIDKYPANIREEDAILYANDLSGDSEVEVTNIVINEGTRLYALNDTDSAAVSDTDDGTEDTAASAGTAAYGVDLGILDESQIVCPDYELYVMIVNYDFTSDYDDMKTVFARLMSNHNRRNVAGMSMTYDTETGLLIGNLEVNMYYMTGTDKIYESPDAGTIIRGTDNIFGTIDLE